MNMIIHMFASYNGLGNAVQARGMAQAPVPVFLTGRVCLFSRFSPVAGDPVWPVRRLKRGDFLSGKLDIRSGDCLFKMVGL